LRKHPPRHGNPKSPPWSSPEAGFSLRHALEIRPIVIARKGQSGLQGRLYKRRPRMFGRVILAPAQDRLADHKRRLIRLAVSRGGPLPYEALREIEDSPEGGEIAPLDLQRLYPHAPPRADRRRSIICSMRRGCGWLPNRFSMNRVWLSSADQTNRTAPSTIWRLHSLTNLV